MGGHYVRDLQPPYISFFIYYTRAFLQSPGTDTQMKPVKEPTHAGFQVIRHRLTAVLEVEHLLCNRACAQL